MDVPSLTGTSLITPRRPRVPPSESPAMSHRPSVRSLTRLPVAYAIDAVHADAEANSNDMVDADEADRTCRNLMACMDAAAEEEEETMTYANE